MVENPVRRPALNAVHAAEKAELLQDYLRSLQQSTLPVFAAVLAGIACAAFLWLHPNSAQVQRWDFFGLVVCLIAAGAWLLRNRYPLGTWFLAAGGSFILLGRAAAHAERCAGAQR